MNILHFSDTHLGFYDFDKVNDSGINVREQDVYDAFTYVIDQIIATKPDLVLHTGDFFHRPWPTNRALTFALEQLKRLESLNIAFVVIAGNHSTPKNVATSPILKVLKTFDFIKPIFEERYEQIVFDEVVIHGIPHINDTERQKAEMERIVPILGKLNILMAHTSIGIGYKMDEYGEHVFPEEKYPLLNQFDYVALGHWHNFQKVKNLKTSWYCGSTERMSKSEALSEKGYCTLTIQAGKISDPEFHPIPARPWLVLEIEACHKKTPLELMAEIQAFTQDNVLDGAIVSVFLEELTDVQLYEFSVINLKTIFKEAFHVIVKRTPFAETKFVSALSRENLHEIDKEFAGFIQSKQDEKDAVRLIEKANYYFNIVEER